jgi:hypothetical protein
MRSRRGTGYCLANVAKNVATTFQEILMVGEIQGIIVVSRRRENVGCRKRYDKTLKNLKPTKSRR